MKKAILFLSLAFGLLSISNAQIQEHTIEIEAKGVFSEIDVGKQNETIQILQGEDEQQKKMAIENILKSPNDYNPPVLYALSRALFQQGNKDEAMFWFYVAQLRARYDANLCMDNSAKDATSILTDEYGPEINKYAFQDIDKLEKTMNRVVNFVRTNMENYDHRWINLHGMWAIAAGLNDEKETRNLSQPKRKWKAIKKKTIDDYYNGFAKHVFKRQKK